MPRNSMGSNNRLFLGSSKIQHLCVEVDEQTAFLRLMHYFKDPPSCKVPQIFKRDRQAFGDPAAAIGLEVSILLQGMHITYTSVSRP